MKSNIKTEDKFMLTETEYHCVVATIDNVLLEEIIAEI